MAAVNHVSATDVTFWLGVIVVLACLGFAIVAARAAQWLPVGLLLFVAIIAGLLFL